MKYCGGCSTEKSLLDFHKNSSKTDGLASQCKVCANKYKPSKKKRRIYNKDYRNKNSKKIAKIYTAWRKQNPDKISAYAVKWKNKYPDRSKEIFRKSSKKYISSNPEKAAAHNALRCAVRRGKVTKWPCQICGNEKSHGHHSSYDEFMWFAVTWLCAKHHKEAHAVV